jgi:hypothetical protein
MQKSFLVLFVVLLTGSCSVLSELGSLTKCEFSFRSVQDPRLCGVEIADKRTFSDFSFMEAQEITMSVIKGSLPFDLIANVEVRNPGPSMAAVSSIQWIAIIDDMEAARGMVNERVEVAPNGGRALVPVYIQTDIIDFLEGSNPQTMLNFILNLLNAGNQPTRVTLKIKPSIMIGQQTIAYPRFFTLTEEFSSGN